MPRRVVSTSHAPTPSFGYSQAVIAGPVLFTAGTGPHDPESGEVIGKDIREQTRVTMRNLEQVLMAAGLTFDDVVKATVHLADLKRDFPGFDAVYREFLNPPFPSRTTVGSTLWDILVEIDVVAVRTAQHSVESGKES